jgi:hypothetical protein
LARRRFVDHPHGTGDVLALPPHKIAHGSVIREGRVSSGEALERLEPTVLSDRQAEPPA